MLDALRKKHCCLDIDFRQRVLDEEQPALKRTVGGSLVYRKVMQSCCWFWRHNDVLQQLERMVGEGEPTRSKMMQQNKTVCLGSR